MEQNITFKNMDGKIYIIAKDNLTYDEFIESLKNRMERLRSLKEVNLPNIKYRLITIIIVSLYFNFNKNAL